MIDESFTPLPLKTKVVLMAVALATLAVLAASTLMFSIGLLSLTYALGVGYPFPNVFWIAAGVLSAVFLYVLRKHIVGTSDTGV